MRQEQFHCSENAYNASDHIQLNQLNCIKTVSLWERFASTPNNRIIIALHTEHGTYNLLNFSVCVASLISTSIIIGWLVYSPLVYVL